MEELSLALNHMMKESSIANSSLANDIHQERPITNTSSAEKRWHGGIEYGKAGMT